MSGFCAECGLLFKDGKCKNGHWESKPPRTLSPTHEIGDIPKSSTSRRLLGSGIEFMTYIAGAWVIASLDLASFGLIGLLSLILISLVVLRDFNAGAFSVAKRVSGMRVVDRRTGQPGSNVQALIRNSYYLGLLLVTLLPLVDFPILMVFKFFVVFDVLMILSSRQGRRLGDLLAGTQVVEARS